MYSSFVDSLALVCFLSAVLLSSRQIIRHLKYFHQPEFQLHICRIILMVPIYSTQSFVSYHMPRVAIVLDTLRDCYEAYALYTFMSLLINYLGGEDVLMIHIEMKGRLRHPVPLDRVFRPIVCNRRFFRILKRGVVQFVFVKPLTAIVAFILEGFDLYGGGHFDWRRGYLYLSCINNVSTGVASYSLILFYLSLCDRLAPFRPLSKFICIKAVIFFSFWQSLVLAGAVQWGLIREASDRSIDARTVAMQIQDWLICIEMLGFAIAHEFAFSYRDFASQESRQHKPLLEGLSKVLKVDDVLQDAHDTFFKRGVKHDFAMHEINIQKESKANLLKNFNDEGGGGGSMEGGEGEGGENVNNSYSEEGWGDEEEDDEYEDELDLLVATATNNNKVKHCQNHAKILEE